MDSDAFSGQIVDDLHQVLGRPSKPVQLPHNKDIAAMDGLEAGIKPRSVLLASRHPIFVDILLSHPSSPQ